MTDATDFVTASLPEPDVWAVVRGSGASIVATDTHVVLVTGEHSQRWRYSELAPIPAGRASRQLSLMTRAGDAISLEIRPGSEEAATQALTVIGLLIARGDAHRRETGPEDVEHATSTERELALRNRDARRR